jgi:hypothetical protein
MHIPDETLAETPRIPVVMVFIKFSLLFPAGLPCPRIYLRKYLKLSHPLLLVSTAIALS